MGIRQSVLDFNRGLHMKGTCYDEVISEKYLGRLYYFFAYKLL